MTALGPRLKLSNLYAGALAEAISRPLSQDIILLNRWSVYAGLSVFWGDEKKIEES